MQENFYKCKIVITEKERPTDTFGELIDSPFHS